MRPARSDQPNLILRNIIFQPGNAKIRLCFDGIFLKKKRVYFCAVVKYQLENNIRKERELLSMHGLF